ncbi:MAG: radical SAM protein, partial [Lachnospiraceae bacterium]|nr:radical SAM protein [Lachnospiraceae bacterium]
YGQEQSPAGAFDAGPLLDLILRCAEIPGLKRIRLGSLEPRLITPDTARAFAHIPALCPHFHLSLQSGCDATLKRMNRHYTSARYAESVAALREAYDRPAITTDVITGFPGETEQEFEETLRFLTDLRLYEIHVFPYSVRPGTVAASLPGQIRRAEKERRSAVLLALTAEQAHTYRESFLGEGLDVLLEEEEEIAGMRYIIGHTERYVRAAVRIGDPAGVPAGTDARNTFVRGDAGGFLTDDTILLDAPHEV